MKLKHIIIIVVALVALLAVLAMAGVIGGKKTEKVTVENAADRRVVETVTASGKVQPETEVKLSSEVSGEVVELLVKEGDRVKKGQVLIKVRPDVLLSGYEKAVASNNTQKAVLSASQQQLNQALATFKNTESTYKRNQELFKQKVISASEFDVAKSEYFSAQADIARLKANVTGSRFSLAQSQANVREAQANLAKTTILAPVDGVISKLSVELGDRILGTTQMAGTEVMRISNLTNMEVNVDVNENDINRVNVGDSAVIEIDAFADKKFKGIVTEIGSSSKDVGSAATSSVDQVTNFLVKVRILPESYNDIKGGAKDLPSPFRPGLSASVDIESEAVRGLSIPIQSVFTGEKSKEDAKPETANNADQEKQKSKLADKTVKQYVYVYANGSIKKVEVTTGIQNDQFIIIKTGLKAGQEVVTGPYSAIQNRLKDGMEVEKTSKDQLFAEPGKK